MQIDGFTLIAQVINFVILLLLLWRVLYGPIVRAMREREARIASRWQEAEQNREQAEQEAQRYRQQRSELEEKRERLLDQAREEAEARRQELLQQARQEVEGTQRRWREALEQEKTTFLAELRRRVSQQTDQVARQALRELANLELESHMIQVFAGRLRALEEAEKQSIAASIRDSDRQVLVRSAFELSEQGRRQLTEAMRDHVVDGDHLDVRFERAPDLICGIEIQTAGRRISWTVDHYMDTLQERILQTLAKVTPEGQEQERDERDA